MVWEHEEVLKWLIDHYVRIYDKIICMINRYFNLKLRIAIAFKSIDDWGRLVFEQQPTRAEP
jgi:hypothetical protein